MSKFFIHRPVFAIVISIMIVLLGIISLTQLPVDQYPQISPPTVSVTTSYTGANADIVNQTVAQVVENQVNGTEGMDYMSSTSDSSGNYSLTVRFHLGTDGNIDTVNVQNNVAIANASLPSDVQAVGVTTKKSSSDMAYVAVLVSPNGTYNRTFIKTYADVYLLDNIKRIKGVGDVQIFGSDLAMRVWLNPDNLADYGLTVANVIQSIKEQNIQAPAGTIGQLPAPRDQEKQITGTVQGRLTTVEDFSNIILKAGDNGSFVRLGDVARVETGDKFTDVLSSYNGKEAIGFAVQLTSDANAMETLQAVKDFLEKSSAEFPPDLTYHSVIDKTLFINASIDEVIETFIEALALVVIIVFLFLQSWRSTLIPVLAVPVSLIGTMAVFVLLNFTINTLTLFAMVLAIGLVVDDAIVVIENVEQHLAKGHDPVRATEIAMEEVEGPVIAVACVLAAVFIPVSFLSGTMGVLYKQFSLTIAFSMALSAFVALTLTPALCAMLLKPHSEEHEKPKGILGSFFAAFNDWFERTKNKYTGAVGWCIGHAKLATVFLLVVCGLTGLLFKILPSTYVPDEDQGYFAAAVILPAGTSMNRTMETVDAYAKEIEEIPGVKGVMHLVGYDLLSGSRKSSAGTVFVTLEDWADRQTVETSVSNIVDTSNILAATKHPEAMAFAFLMPSLPGLGSVGGFSMQLMDMTGHSDEELDAISGKILAAANARPELEGVRSTYSIDSPTYTYEIDREQVKTMGVQLSDVFTALQVNFGGTQVNDFTRFNRNYKVMLQADSTYRSETDNLKFMFVKGEMGQLVPLDTLITPRLSTAPPIISRFNGARSIEIQGNAAEGFSSGQAIAAMEEVAKETVPAGFQIEWSGQSREEKTASGSTGKVMALSLIFVFLSLAALYESWSVPYAVLMTVPIGVFGALFSEWSLSYIEAFLGAYNPGLQNSVYMQIGIIMLMGLAAKNAILIVEFAKVRTDKGMDAVQAALESAGLRLRPIIMTSLAFIIGCLPLAVASGAGAAARNGMGVAVVGGMLFATCLGIFLIPVFFVIVEAIAKKFVKGQVTDPASGNL